MNSLIVPKIPEEEIKISGSEILAEASKINDHILAAGKGLDAEGYYLECRCDDGASGNEIAKCLHSNQPPKRVSIQVVVSNKQFTLLGVFLNDPPRKLNLEEIKKHVIWGSLADLKKETQDFLQ